MDAAQELKPINIQSWSEYLPLAARTAKMFFNNEDNLSHASQGMGTELGELCDVFSRHTFGIKQADNLPNAKTAALVELGDLAWYPAHMMNCLGLKATIDNEVKAVKEKVWPIQARHEVLEARLIHLNYHYGPDSFDELRAPHYLLLVGTAVGNLTSLLKKRTIYGHTVDTGDFCLAFGEVANSIELFATEVLGLTISDVFNCNITKLKVRYPDKYSDVLAAARLDVQPTPNPGKLIVSSKQYLTLAGVKQAMKIAMRNSSLPGIEIDATADIIFMALELDMAVRPEAYSDIIAQEGYQYHEVTSAPQQSAVIGGSNPDTRSAPMSPEARWLDKLIHHCLTYNSGITAVTAATKAGDIQTAIDTARVASSVWKAITTIIEDIQKQRGELMSGQTPQPR